MASVAADRREAARIRDRIGAIEVELEALDAEEATALERVAAEDADVRELQRFTLRGVIADLRGQKDDQLRREAAEAANARHEVILVRGRQAAAVRDLDALQDRLVALGDPDADWGSAMDDRRGWTDAYGSDRADRLEALAVELGGIDDERRECDEARVAAVGALAALDEVDVALSDRTDAAGDDGHADRLDDLCALVRAAEDALRGLASELHDLGLRLTTPDVVARWDRAFERFFAGLVGDEELAVRMAEAAGVVGHALERVGQIAADVDARSRTLSARETELFEERRELLADVAVPVDEM